MAGSGKSNSRFSFSVRTKILLAFLALSLGALLVTAFIAFVQMEDTGQYAVTSSTNLGNRASADSTEALERDAQASLLRLAKDQAYISNIIIEQIGDDLNIMAYYAGEILDNPGMVRDLHLPTQDERPDDPLSTSVVDYSPGADKTIPPEERRAAGMMNQILLPVYST
ncbi:MAG: serine/threonine protein phosphatase, partial [Methanoregula sp.]